MKYTILIQIKGQKKPVIDSRGYIVKGDKNYITNLASRLISDFPGNNYSVVECS